MTLSDDFLRALGRISANFQALEASIAFLTWSLINADQTIGQIITSQVSFNRLCDLLSSLFRYRVKEQALLEKLEEILRKASEAEQRRNTVIHSVWMTDDVSGEPFRLKITSKRKKGLDIHTENIDAAELNKIADFIRNVAEDMLKFIADSNQAADAGQANQP